MKSFDQLSGMELDTLQEIGSIGSGNAATALSSMLGCEVRIDMPEVRIMEYNEAIEWLGGPELITAGVLVRLEGEVNGTVMSVQREEFTSLVLEKIMGRTITNYDELTELDSSALIEVGNIMISAFINAISGMTGVAMRLTVPAFAVEMQGAILTIPMAEYAGQSNHIMTIGTNFICNQTAMVCRILLSPDVRSLNLLLSKLGVLDE